MSHLNNVDQLLQSEKLINLEEKRVLQHAIYKQYLKKAMIALLFFFLIIPFFKGVYYLFKSTEFRGTFLKQYKTNLVLALAPEKISECEYVSETGVSQNLVTDTKMFKRPSRFFSKNFHKAKYKDIVYTLSDIRLEEKIVIRTKQGTMITYNPYFTGKFIKIDLLKNLNTTVRCFEKGFGNNLSTTTIRGLTNVKLESLEFNKKFNTQSLKPHDAFFVLTPTVQEKLLLLESKIHGDFYFQLMDNCIYFAVNGSKEMFYVDPSKPLSANKVIPLIELLELVPTIIDSMFLDSDKFRDNG